jgi:2-dehydropantoate 2-reductase
MLEDVDAKRPTEVELINGSLVREAERLGVPVPLHQALYRLIRAREASWSVEHPQATEPESTVQGRVR